MENTQNNSGTAPVDLDTATAILQMIPAAVYTCDTHGRITFFNNAARELWGRTPALGQDQWCGSLKMFKPDGTPLPLSGSPMAVTLKEGRPVLGSTIIIERPDGTQRHIMPHPKPVFDAKGTLTGAINTLVDVTPGYGQDIVPLGDGQYKSLSEILEQRVAERTFNLKKSEERYHKMIDEVQDYAIVLLDTDGYIINWNKGAEKIKGYSEKEIIGKNFRIFYRDNDRASKLPETLIQQAHDTGRAMHEGWRLRKDGTTFWGSIVITALHDGDNNIIGFSKVTRDLTERKLADDRMANYAKDIEFRNKQLEEYAYIASHDLQEPLRKIQVFSEMLEININDHDTLLRNIGKIKTAAKRMSDLIKDVLEYSQLSRADELFKTIDLSKVLAAVIDDFDLLIEQKNVTVNYDILPVIEGIPIQMHQLFSNLLSNAIKFSSARPVIDITAQQLAGSQLTHYPELNPGNNYVNIVFKDNGVGFDQQYGEQVFKMFKRLSNNAGTGIGLALCKKIIENHGGHINVTSQAGVGTAFTIILPVKGNAGEV